MTRAIAAIAVAIMLVGAVAPTAHAGSLISFSSCGDEFHGRNCVPENARTGDNDSSFSASAALAFERSTSLTPSTAASTT